MEIHSSKYKKNLDRSVEFFFVFAWLWPTVRLLIIGRSTASSFVELFFSVLPDLLFFLVLICGFFFYKNNGRKIKLSLFDKIFILFFISNVILGFILGRSAGLGLEIKAFRLTYLPMLFYFVGRIYSGDMEKLFDRIFMWFAIFGISALLIHYLFPDFDKRMFALGGYPDELSYFIPRLGTLLWNPILFGLMMSYSCCYYFYKIVSSGNKKYYLLFAICWGLVFLSVSRGAILAFFISFLFIAILNRNYKRIFYSIGVIIGMVVLISLIFSVSSHAFIWIFSSTFDTLSLTNGVTRVEQWRKTLIDFMNQPMGYGFGRSGFIAHWYLSDSPVASAHYITDGWYLKLACETGIFGVISFLIFAGSCFFISVKNVWKKNKNISLFAAGLFILICVHNIPSNSMDYYPFVSLLWLALGQSFFIFETEHGKE